MCPYHSLFTCFIWPATSMSYGEGWVDLMCFQLCLRISFYTNELVFRKGTLKTAPNNTWKNPIWQVLSVLSTQKTIVNTCSDPLPLTLPPLSISTQTNEHTHGCANARARTHTHAQTHTQQTPRHTHIPGANTSLWNILPLSSRTNEFHKS